VFRAWTDPELVPLWLGPRDLDMEVVEYDVSTGGRYHYIHRDDSGEYRFRGVFHTVTKNERIIQTFEYEGTPDEVCLETMTFEDLDGRTRLRGHSVFATVEGRDAFIASGMEHGVRASMDRLAEILAR
jgi:uncharacterized protein YndB with AHSA1/START domain